VAMSQVVANIPTGLPGVSLPVHAPGAPSGAPVGLPVPIAPPAPPAPPTQGKAMFAEGGSSSSANATAPCSSTASFGAMAEPTPVSPSADTSSGQPSDEMPPHAFPDPPATNASTPAPGPTNVEAVAIPAGLPQAPAGLHPPVNAPAPGLPVSPPSVVPPANVAPPAGIPSLPVTAPAGLPPIPAAAPVGVPPLPVGLPLAGPPSLPINPPSAPAQNSPQQGAPQQAYEIADSSSSDVPNDAPSGTPTNSFYPSASATANATDTTSVYPTSTP